MQRYRATFILLIAIIAISCAALFFKKTAPTHPLIASGFRLIFAAVLFLPLSVRHLKDWNGQAFAWAGLAGVCYAIHFGAWVWSLSLTSVAASVTLVTATPIFLAVIAWVSGKDRPSTRLWISILLSLAGVSLIGLHDSQAGQSAWIGDILALIGALGMVGYLLIARHLRALNPWVLMNIATAVGGGILISIALCMGIPLQASSDEAMFWIVMATLIPQMVGHTALTYSLKFSPPTSVAMATVAEPAGATLLAWLFLGETVSLVVIGGCLITAMAILISARELDQD